MIQPPRFEYPTRPDYVWKLKKTIYGLKQAHRVYQLSSDFGFGCSFPDPSLSVYHQDTYIIYMLLYIDDMILTDNNDIKCLRVLAQSFI